MSKERIDAIVDMCEEDALVITNDQLDGGTPLAYMMAHECYFENTTDEKLCAFLDSVKK